MSARCPQISSGRPPIPPPAPPPSPSIAPKIPGLDGRTREARLIRELRAELVAHVGGKPSATQAALIEQVAQLRLRIAAMDRKFAQTGAQTDHDSRTYLAWANAYSRLLRQLGLKGAAEKPPALADYLAGKAAA